MIKIGMWVEHARHCTWKAVKVKRSKVKVTRSRDVVTQKRQIYPVNFIR